ncbi:MAG: PD-(D/E)XK nuclease family protein [Lachnospiraceae bacterium]|nr:PD-(D/E)XK nuclease family protein [Lachnospiraceae bacterium]
MSLQWITGSSGAGKSYVAYRQVIEEALARPEERFFVLVPEQFSLQTQKTIVGLHPRKGILNIDLLTFARLGYRVFDAVGMAEDPVLDDTGKVLVLRRILSEQQENLTVLSSSAGKSGFASEVKSMISEFSQYNVSPQILSELLEELSQTGTLSGKLRDLLLLYGEFQKALSGKYTTTEWMMQELADRIEEASFLRGATVLLDGYTGFTPQQLVVLRKLFAVCRKVIITVTLDPNETPGEKSEEHTLFHLSQETIRLVREQAILAGCEEEEIQTIGGTPYRFRESEDLATLEKNLYRYPWVPSEETPEDIALISCKNPLTEAYVVAEKIRAYAREFGWKYNEFAVVTGDLGTYGRLLSGAFRQMGIPCFVDQNEEVFGSPLPEFLMGALRIVSERFKPQYVFQMLRSGLTALTREEVDLLENYVRAHGVRSLAAWSRPFAYGEDAQVCEPIRVKWMEIISPFVAEVKEAQNAADLTRALYQLMESQEAFQTLAETKEGWEEEALRPETSTSFERIYAAVLHLFDQIIALMGEEALSVHDYAKVLEEGLRAISVGQIPGSANQVMIGDLKRTRLKDIRALFVVGVNDGVTPAPGSSGGILTDREKEKLKDLGLTLAPTRKEESYQDIFYLYMNLTKPERKLVMTLARSDASGKLLRPSGVIAKLQQIFTKLPLLQDEDRNDDPSALLREDDGLSYLVRVLREEEEPSAFSEELMRYYAAHFSEEELEDWIAGIYFSGDTKKLTPEEAIQLYGEHLQGSVTKLQDYAGCPFAYYAGAGLLLKERRDYEASPVDLGNLLHEAMCRFGRACLSRGISWGSLSDEERDSLAEQCLQEAVSGESGEVFLQDHRSEYLIKRLSHTFLRTMEVLCRQVAESDFEPLRFELPFDRIPELTYDLGEGKKLSLRGKIDRIDLAEVDGKTYLKVLDYKTGAQKYDWTRMYYGLQMQLPVYLKGALSGESRLSRGEVHPAGIFYSRIQDPYLSDVKGDPKDAFYGKFQVDGLANETPRVLAALDHNLGDAEGLNPGVKSLQIPVSLKKDGTPDVHSKVISEIGLKKVLDRTDHNLKRMGKEILDGVNEIAPMQFDASGKSDACSYCSYRDVCGFDARLGGFGYRKMKKLEKEEALQRMAAEGGEEDV